jgi:uncharacterized protein (TIGR04255 family)
VFGFPKTEYVIYNRNFLRKVIFQLDFKKTPKVIENEDFLKSIFINDFPRFVKAQGNGLQITFGNEKPKLETLAESENFILKSQDGQSIIEINDKCLRLSFDNTAYKSSNDIRKVLSLFNNFLENQIELVEKISVKKINIVEFDNENNPNGILYFLLNKSMIGNVDSFPNSELINHNLQSVNYKNEDFLLNLKYGMNIPPIQNLKIGQVIIDIEISKHTKTNINDIHNIFEEINTEIFNVFNSLINENTKNILNGN